VAGPGNLLFFKSIYGVRKLDLEITEQENGERIEKILKMRFTEISKSQWRYYFFSGKILKKGQLVKWGERMVKGAVITLTTLPEKSDLWLPAITKSPLLEIAGEGDFWLAMDKPPLLPTLPRHPEDIPSAAGSMMFLFPQIVETSLPRREGGIVNRLDNNTSGLLLVGKTPEIYIKMRKHFASHRIEKQYWAVVDGFMDKRVWCHGRVISEAGPTSSVAWEDGEGEKGKRAISLIEPIYQSKNHTLVSVTTRFGRRHQVRVQLASLGFTIVGDSVYGKPNEKIAGHFLWARSLKFSGEMKSRERDVNEPLHIISKKLDKTWLKFIKENDFMKFFPDVTPF
jgi:23S rRNA pseudouridine1911/1915/1917 synthase